ncbi:MAG TPA: hypothetical protein VFM18_17670 [Methanosarcina sp.]|nr:hypothetical protein [Methanosarcina sp.]
MRHLYRHKEKTWVTYDIYPTAFIESEEEDDLVVCIYTKSLVLRKDAVVLGPVVPQAPHSYLCHPLASKARTASIRLFNEFEKNCNTCKHLERLPFDKNSLTYKAGLLPGKCNKAGSTPVYPQDNGTILFPPDDHLGQNCYESRTYTCLILVDLKIQNPYNSSIVNNTEQVCQVSTL